MSRRKQHQPISDLLRRTIAESEVAYLTLQQATGITRACIQRFVDGRTSLRLDLADRLASYFGLELVRKSNPPGADCNE